MNLSVVPRHIALVWSFSRRTGVCICLSSFAYFSSCVMCCPVLLVFMAGVALQNFTFWSKLLYDFDSFLHDFIHSQKMSFPVRVIKINYFACVVVGKTLLLWQGLCSEALLLHTWWNSLHKWMYICSIVQSFFNISVKLILTWCWKCYLLHTQCWILHHFVLYCQLKNWHTPGDGSFCKDEYNKSQHERFPHSLSSLDTVLKHK